MATFQGTFSNASATDTNVTSLTISNVTVSAGTNLAMAVLVSIESTTPTVTGITWNGSGTGFALITGGAKNSGGAFSRVEAWGLINPAVASLQTVVITISSASKIVGGVIVATSVNQGGVNAGSFRTPATGGATTGTGTGSTTVGSVGGSDLVFDVLDIDGTGHTATIGADQTERWNRQIATGATTGAGSSQLGSTGGVMSWTWTTSSPWAQVASAFVDDAAGGAAAPLAVFDRLYRGMRSRRPVVRRTWWRPADSLLWRAA